MQLQLFYIKQATQTQTRAGLCGFIKIKKVFRLRSIFIVLPLWDTADAEINIPSFENPELTTVLPLKPRAGHTIAMHASLAARNFFQSYSPPHPPPKSCDPYCILGLGMK